MLFGVGLLFGIGLLCSQRDRPKGRPPRATDPSRTGSNCDNKCAAPRTTVLHDLPTQGASSALVAALWQSPVTASADPPCESTVFFDFAMSGLTGTIRIATPARRTGRDGPVDPSLCTSPAGATDAGKARSAFVASCPVWQLRQITVPSTSSIPTGRAEAAGRWQAP